ncbi:hypothetical protein CDEST_14771 [Colletotrichum destructivum]|uniref:Uncharacterized protein n=1 Tax=Colletotrichum destructivum TaxID=34406 RepID=A0AAX4J2W7_9PEZI|nr:hypothetical protein CDEST_14771 [Colletotrichum destructivum]
MTRLEKGGVEMRGTSKGDKGPFGTSLCARNQSRVATGRQRRHIASRTLRRPPVPCRVGVGGPSHSMSLSVTTWYMYVCRLVGNISTIKWHPLSTDSQMTNARQRRIEFDTQPSSRLFPSLQQARDRIAIVKSRDDRIISRSKQVKDAM